MSRPTIGFEDSVSGLRVLIAEDGPIVELRDGLDGLGMPRWKRVDVDIATFGGMPTWETWAQIAGALGVSEDTALSYADRNVDPLPARRNHRGEVWIYRCVLRDWIARQDLPHTVYREVMAARSGRPTKIAARARESKERGKRGAT